MQSNKNKTICLSKRYRENSTQSNNNSISFDASKGVIPNAPSKYRLCTIRFKSCPDTNLALTLSSTTSQDVDVHGMSPCSWWLIDCGDDLPQRYVMLYNGSHSMAQWLQRYAFLDATGCANHKYAEAYYRLVTIPCAIKQPSQIPTHLADMKGIPQFFKHSGVCWFASLCTIAFADLGTRKFIQQYMPQDVRHLADTCLYNRDDAQKLRNFLWDEHAIGDNVHDVPENDGCNGSYEFILFCANFSIPLIVYNEKNGNYIPIPFTLKDKRNRSVKMTSVDQSKDHLLLLRHVEADHKRFPVLRRILVNGKRYRWVGCFAGQRKCGHQVGIASTDGSWRSLVVGDADCHKDQIGPEFIVFEGSKWKTLWWKALEYVIHVTKYGFEYCEFCDHNLHNKKDDSLDRFKGANGKNSIDCLYRYAA